MLKTIVGETIAEIEPRIRLIPFNDIKLSTKRRDLVKGIIPRVGLAVVWGPPKSGKSFWSFDVAMHIALGWEYRGRRTHQGPVVYCSFEGQHGLEARVEAFRQRFLAEEPDPIPFYLEPVTLDLVKDHAELIMAIQRQLTAAPPVAVVLDTLNRSFQGSESSDEDMTAYIRAADVIRETFGCVVIIVHHCGIAGDRPRGHTSLSGALDTQLSVKRDAADNILVEVELAKDGAQGATIASRLDVVEVGIDEDGELISSCVIVPADSNTLAKPERVTGAAKVALDILKRAIADAGEDPPASSHIPANVRVISADLWRQYCYAGTLADSDDAHAKRKAFGRASKRLQELKLVGTWNGKVWAV